MADWLLSFSIYGLTIVIALLIALLIKGIVVVLERSRRALPVAPPPAVAPVASVVAAGIPPEHLAVIAAAVAALLGDQRIVHIEDGGRGRAWTATARASHYASHTPRRRH
jgi:Na+-transporting methylmalonyl-CoA/oxaloacetate decarboxylase gamma subunit